MILVAALASFVLILFGSVHLLWAIGIWWPLHEQKALARAVAGFKGIEAMPPRAASLTVALALTGMSLLALSLAGAIAAPAPRWLVALAGAGAAGVFLARGAAGFTSRWAQLTPEQPFRSLDRRYYSPLCLGLGAVFLGLTWCFAR